MPGPRIALRQCLGLVNRERLRIMRELGMSNVLEAEQFMIDQTDQHLSMLAKVREKRWPEKYKKKVSTSSSRKYFRVDIELGLIDTFRVRYIQAN
jgi:hypothetical protein